MTKKELLSGAKAARAAVMDGYRDGQLVRAKDLAVALRMPYGTVGALGSRKIAVIRNNKIVIEEGLRNWVAVYRRPLLASDADCLPGAYRHTGDGVASEAPSVSVPQEAPTDQTLSEEVSQIAEEMLALAERLESVRVKARACDELRAKIRASLSGL